MHETTHAPPQPFIDRDTPPLIDGQFATLAKKIHQYWQDDGSDVLPLSRGDNQLVSASVATKSEQACLNAPMPDACVLVAITDEAVPRILLTQRAATLNSHAGEVSFVGGKVDETDASSRAAALREAHEEVGLMEVHTTLIGYLPMQMSRAGLLVRPVVMAIDAAAMGQLVANEDEIGAIFWLPFADILSPPIDHQMMRQVGDQRYILRTPAWLGCDGVGEQVVWGLTARILANLAEIGFGKHYPWYYRLA